MAFAFITATKSQFYHQGSCAEGWSYFDGHCYIVTQAPDWRTWDGALDYCGNLNSYLVEIITDAQLEFVNDLLKHHDFYGFFWNGATDRVTQGTFVYKSSGRKVPEKFWRDGYPDGVFDHNCVQMTRRYNQGLEFVNKQCYKESYFACEKIA